MQPTRSLAHALPALLAALAGGCDRPRPYAALERARDHACTCKDVDCAEVAEGELAAALVTHRAAQTGSSIAPAVVPLLAEARGCMTSLWRTAQPATLFGAEAEPPRGPAPCETYLPKAMAILRCDRASLALRTRVASDVLELRTHWSADGAPLRPELELYDRCLAALMRTMGAQDCSTRE